jgi:phosphopantothenoylcysteine synthetase/decarboxylase
LAAAQRKLAAKGCDFVLANNPLAAGSGFGTGAHQVTLVGPEGVLWRSPSLPKIDLARAILDQLDAAHS